MTVRRSHLLITGAATLLAAAALSALPSPWSAWRPATCMPAGCFCEGIRDGLVRQPANTVSGLAFVGVGLLVVFSGRMAPGAAPGAGGLLRTRRVYPALFGGAAVLIGLGTAFFHASLTFAGQTVDVLGMYLLVTFLLVYDLSRLAHLSERLMLALYVAGNAGLFLLLVAAPELRRYVFAALVAAVLALEMLLRRRGGVRMRAQYLAGAVLVLGAGFAAWVLDLTGVACDPDSIVQGHAVWHLAGAGAVWLAFLFYISERAFPDVGG